MVTKKNQVPPMTVGRIMLIGGAAIVVAGLWYIATVPWGLNIVELAPFIAPGALLGIGAGWMSHALTPDRWTWIRARNAVITGALVLPPIIAIALALMGARPERVLSSTVRASWLALIGGTVWGAGVWMVQRIEKR